MVITPAARGVAFLLGFGFAFLPSFGPFAAVLFILTARLRFRLADLPWLGAALLFAVAIAVHDGLSGALFGFLQVIGPWAVYRAFSELRQPHFERFPRQAVLQGLFVGFVVVVALGFSTVRLNFSYPTITQAITWGGNAGLFAHTVLVVGSLIALLVTDARLRIATLSVAAIGILAAGSREAAFGLVLVLAYFQVQSISARRLGQGVSVFALAAVLVATVGFGPRIGLGQIGYLITPAAGTTESNLVRGSEVPTGDWWDRRQVAVQAGTVRLAGRPLTEYRVSKRGDAGWLRLQQVIPLQSGTSYTASAWVLDPGAAQAGIQGWGQLRNGTVFALTTRLVDHKLVASLRGPGTLERYGIARKDGNWRRVYATFTYDGAQHHLDWSVGLAPDARTVASTTASFAGFQFERGSLTRYQPGTISRGLGFVNGRLRMWHAAWVGAVERPWFGWGPGSFPSFYQRTVAASSGSVVQLPAHAHDLFLEVFFERGIVGIAGLILLLVGLAWGAVRHRDIGILVVLTAVLLANVFDYTLFFGGVIYPLAAVAGWRAGSRREARPATDSMSRQFLVRLVLAAVDLALAWAALSLSARLAPLLGVGAPPASALGRYALFLWPTMAWREGLYPGYGLTESDELRHQVLGACYAGILFLMGAIVFERDLGISPAVVIGTTVIGVLLLPIGRALSKRLLWALGLWGRAVVILGSGPSATNIARTLDHRPLDGLRPVAVFADYAPGVDGNRATVGGVPLIGPVSAANTFARREGIHHAIVAMESDAGPLHLQKLDPAEDAFTIVQYVPDLPGLPVLGVRASSLDNLLALEVRNELASPVNRLAKRALDLTATFIGGLLVSPVLLVLGLAVTLDSRGPVFFGHTRIGRSGRKIRVWKFRTMAKDAPEALERHLRENPDLRVEWEAHHKLKDDPRVTRVGRFLRRYSLDELPQLWNVLKGEMSLVGPRPIVDDEVRKYAEAFDLYTMVRPGMTGYWQISGRSDTDYSHRVELDSFYVRNWSVWLDIVVLIKTLAVVLKRDGAY